MRFTFKTNKPTGKYKSFYNTYHDIKLNGDKVGSIMDESVFFSINFMIIKEDINEDGNPNCSWRWIKLSRKTKTIDEAKEFLNNHIKIITETYKLHKAI